MKESPFSSTSSSGVLWAKLVGASQSPSHWCNIVETKEFVEVASGSRRWRPKDMGDLKLDRSLSRRKWHRGRLEKKSQLRIDAQTSQVPW